LVDALGRGEGNVVGVWGGVAGVVVGRGWVGYSAGEAVGVHGVVAVALAGYSYSVECALLIGVGEGFSASDLLKESFRFAFLFVFVPDVHNFSKIY
jgi:hypothetical protein